jgi:hypothetical protein
MHCEKSHVKLNGSIYIYLDHMPRTLGEKPVVIQYTVVYIVCKSLI